MGESQQSEAQTPVIIEVAVNGAGTKDRSPHFPCSTQEIVADAIACIDAGATIIHTHNDNIRKSGAIAAEAYAEVYREIRAVRPEAILHPTVVLADEQAERFAHLRPLAEQNLVDMASFDPGSTNVAFNPGSDGLPQREFVYANSYGEIAYAFASLCELGLGGSLAIYEPSFLRATLGFHAAGLLPRGSLVKLYFGGGRDPSGGPVNPFSFGLPPTEKALEAYLEMVEGSGLPWAAAVPGGDLVACGLAALTLQRGGHLRVGLEDYAGSRQPTNLELVSEAVTACAQAGRPVATARQARALLGFPTV